jgi:O-antigen/teichoic acid export membrane protein
MSERTGHGVPRTGEEDGGSNVFVRSGLTLRALAGDTLFYGIVAGLSRASAVILIPFFTRVLSVSAFGILDTLWTLTNVALLLGNAGVDLATAYYIHSVPAGERNAFLLTGLCLRAGFGLCVAVVGFATSTIVSALVFNTPAFSAWTALSYLVVPFTLVVTYSLDLLRNERRRAWFLVLSLVRVAMLLGGTWWLVAGNPADLVGAFLMFRALPEALTAAVLLVLLYDRFKGSRISATAARKILTYGLPLVPASLLLWLSGFADRWFLYQQGTPEAVGVYALAVKVGMLLAVFAGAVQMAFNPFSLAVRDHRDAESFYARSFSMTMLAALAIVMILGANLEWILHLAGGSRYAGAAMPATLLLLGNLGLVGAIFFATGANVERKTGTYLYAAASALLVVLLGCRWLVPFWGPTGAAVAVGTGNVVLAVVMLLLARRIRPIPYRLLPVVTGACVCAGITMALGTGGGLRELSPVFRNGIALAGIFLVSAIMLTAGEKAGIVRRLIPGRSR